MLVLTRKLNEQIHIGRDVTITIVRLAGNTVRIGIEAPREVPIRRAELPLVESIGHPVRLGRPRGAVNLRRTERAEPLGGSPIARDPAPRSVRMAGRTIHRPR
ncbi:MAG: carbon storage regulator [Pirellulales bacterium]|nr:carbon storage regulator [Pirellulales bacterium]